MITKSQTFRSVTALPSDAGLPRLRVSTTDVDRDFDRVIASGLDSAPFLKNPVLCWGHDHKEIPIGSVTSLTVQDSSVDMTWRWLEGDPFSSRVKNAWEQGVVRAASIGFLPLESSPNDFGGRDYTKWELTEVSLVAIPSNRAAVKMLKSLGLYEPDATDLYLEIADHIPPPSHAIAEEAARLAQAALRKRLDQPFLEIEDEFEIDEQVITAGVTAAYEAMVVATATAEIQKAIDYACGKVR